MSSAIDVVVVQVTPEMIHNWGWFLAFGIFLMSMFFLFAGFYQVIASFWAHLPGWGWQALNGIIAAVMGWLRRRRSW